MNVPKKQHFVPKSYLGGFTNPEKEECLWVFDKQGGNPSFSLPMSVGYKNYTYQVEQPDGTVDKFSLEYSLATLDDEGIHSRCPPIACTSSRS
jgi:Protein of unknown function (DUF4238)